MTKHADLAADLLRKAAAFYRQVAESNPGAAQALQESADTFDSVATLVERDSTGSLPAPANDEVD